MITVEQIRAGRAMLNWKQHELALKADISVNTLNNIERGAQTDPKFSTMRAIQQALEAEGIVFTDDKAGSLGVQRKMNARQEKTLLIIDDSKNDRALYKSWGTKLPDKKYTIVEAGSAKEGYDAFRKVKPDCIILDFMMYGKNGFQLLVEMKNEYSVIPPIIFVTAMHNDFIKKDALALGVHAYLDKKTLTQERLYEVVAEALA